VVFIGDYSSSHARDFIGFDTALFGDTNAWYLEQVNKAIDDAVMKVYDDPAFIAAITPPLAVAPRARPSARLQ
jgi:hypothetical protein